MLVWFLGRVRRNAAVKRKLVIALVVIAGLLLFTPTIVLHSPLRGRILAGLVPPEVGTLSAKRITAGWLTPISAEEITLFDTDGNRVADIPRLSINRTILGLLGNRRDLGLIRLENPNVYTTVDQRGSSLERLIAAQQSASGDTTASDSGSPIYRLEVVGGALLWRDTNNGETWSAESITAAVDHPANGELRVEATGSVKRAGQGTTPDAWPQPQDQPTGRFELRWATAEQETQIARLVCQQLPLSAVEPWLRRFDGQLQMDGQLSGEISTTLPSSQVAAGNSNGKLQLAGVSLQTTTTLGEPIRLNEAALTWKMNLNGGRLVIDSLSLASDVALLEGRGEIPPYITKEIVAGQFTTLGVVAESNFQADGRLHLARLAEVAPSLLKIREGVELTQGQLQFSATNEPTDGGRRLVASVKSSPISGLAGGQRFSWDAPLDINLSARQLPTGMRFDRVVCQSDFLNVTGSGDSRQLQVAGQVDLDELTRRLEQFVDLSDWRLTGSGKLDMTCQAHADGRFTADGTGTLQNLVVEFQGDTIASEPHLDWQADLTGVAAADALWPQQLNRGQLSLSADRDQLSMQITQPTALQSSMATTRWPLKVVMSGGLESWAQRLRPWVDLSEWQLAGAVDLTAGGDFQAEPLVVTCRESSLEVEHFQATSEGVRIREPRVRWSGDLLWDSASGSLASQDGELLSSTFAASLRDWFWTVDARQAQQVGGLAAVRLDLARLAAIFQQGEQPEGMSPRGEVSGNVKLAAQQGEVVAAIDLMGLNVKVESDSPALPGQTPVRKAVWQEPQLRLVGTVGYTPETDRLSFDGLQTQSNTLAIAASGSIEQLTSAGRVNLAGTADYDLASFLADDCGVHWSRLHHCRPRAGPV